MPIFLGLIFVIFVIAADHSLYGSPTLDWYNDQTIVDSKSLSPYLQIFVALELKRKRLFPYPPLSYQIVRVYNSIWQG